jgi:hypothetical protein
MLRRGNHLTARDREAAEVHGDRRLFTQVL